MTVRAPTLKAFATFSGALARTLDATAREITGKSLDSTRAIPTDVLQATLPRLGPGIERKLVERVLGQLRGDTPPPAAASQQGAAELLGVQMRDAVARMQAPPAPVVVPPPPPLDYSKPIETADIVGHENSVCVWVTSLSDGRFMSRSPQSDLRVWNADGTTGPILDTAAPPTRSVAFMSTDKGGTAAVVDGSRTDATVLSDGRIAFVNDKDLTFIQPDGSIGPVLHIGSSDRVMALPDGGVATVGEHTLRVWGSDGTPRETLPNCWPSLVAPLSDGRFVFYTTRGTLSVWTPSDNTIVDLPGATLAAVTELLVLRSGDIAAADTSGTIRTWHADGSAGPSLRDNDQDEAPHIIALPGGYIASSTGNTWGGTLKVWSPAGSEIFSKSTWPIVSLTALTDGKIVTGFTDGRLRVWDFELL